MAVPTNKCPVCGAGMIQTATGDNSVWTCPSHGDFTGGTGSSTTSAATVQTDAEAQDGATSGDLTIT
jgi:hypothetical protein